MSLIDNLRIEQSNSAVDLISTLQTVELNIIELCNRTCSFCPRSDSTLYKNLNNQMSVNTVKSIASSLKSINYSNRISIAGFGEPFLHKQLVEYVKILSTAGNPKWIEIITNSDFLSYNKISELVNAGCTNLTISMYDKDISDEITQLVRDLPIDLTFKHCYSGNMTLVNRVDILSNSSSLNINKPCYLPFYKMLIDWNGDVIICNNDWGRESIFGNVNKSSISDLWLHSKLTNIRETLSHGLRKNINPCKKCNIDGTMYGSQSFQIFIK